MANRIYYGQNFDSYIEDDVIFGGCNFSHSICNGTEWQPGVAACAEFTFTTTHSFSVGDLIIWRIYKNSNWYMKGKFIVKSRKRVKDKYTYTCYDLMMKLEEFDISSTWDNLWTTHTSNITLWQIYIAICNAVGISPNESSFVNSDYTIDKKRFTCNNMTARQLMGYIAEVACGHSYIAGAGYLAVKKLGTTSKHTYVNTEYKNVEVGTDPVNVIDSVWAGAMSDDTGILVEETSGTHDNTLKIVGNPLLFNDGPNTTPTTQYNRVRTALTNILTYVPVEYKAVDISIFGENDYTLGDKLQVTDSLGTHVFYVMSKTNSASGTTFKCVGNTNRDKYISPIDNITGVSTTTSSLKVETDQIRGEVNNLEGDVSAIEISLDSIDLSVTNSGTTSQIKLSKDGTVIASPTVTMTGKVNNSDLTSGDIEVVIGGNGGDGSLLIKDSNDNTRVNLDAGSNTYTLGGWTVNSNSISRTKSVGSLSYTNKLDGLGMEFDLTHDSTDTQADVEGRQVTSSDYPTYANDAAIEINTPILYINHHAQNGKGTTNLNDAKIFLNGEEFTGGGSGTSNYNNLSNKPQINGTELINNKTSSDLGLQSTLVSGTNIKTINNTTLLGSGNITIGSFNYEVVTGYVNVDADTEWELNPDYVEGKTYKYSASVYTNTICSDLTQNVVIDYWRIIVTPSDPHLAQYYNCMMKSLTHGRTWTNTHYRTTVYADKLFEGDDSVTIRFMAFRPL